MGAVLSCSCFGASSNHARETLPEPLVAGKESRSSASIIDHVKFRSLRTAKDVKIDLSPMRTQQEKDQYESKQTLEDWLLDSSPALNRSHASGEWQVLKHSSNKRVHPSSVDPRDSFSKERLLEVDEDGKGSEVTSSTFKRRQSGKVKKKVSFRSPKKDDIIIFTSLELMDGGDD